MANVTWDEINRGSGVVLSNGNLSALVPTSRLARATTGKLTGKWYWEIDVINDRNFYLGITNDLTPLDSNNAATQNTRLYRSSDGKKYPGGIEYGQSYTAGDIISVLLDLDNGNLEFWKNGVSQGISSTDVKSMGMVYPVIFKGGFSGDTIVTANFGASPFEYTPPLEYLPYGMGDILVKDGNRILTFDKQWNEIGTEPINKSMFVSYGMFDENFTRSTRTISKQMTNSGTLGQGKTFSYELDLNKFHQIQSLDVS